MGFVIFMVMGLYLLISLGVVAWAVRYAKKNGKSTKRWGLSAALVMFLIPCWDWIPTVVAHKYYCEKEAGFWVYKPLDQWKKENPGAMETLVANKGAPSTRQGDMVNYTDTYFLNQRFNWVVKHNGQFLFNRWRHEQEAVDAKTGAVLARYVDFSTAQVQRQAGWSGWKFWLAEKHCIGGDRNQGLMYSFEHNIRGVEK
ncbi:MAG TPA: hypothetical protein VMW07_05575 [Gallionella sp.]|nr:hypothetical protein [Gallionella sp.]